MHSVLRVLLIEDNEDDAFFVLREIRQGGYQVDSSRVQSAEGVQQALERQTWDLIICDYSMPNFNALEALRLVKESELDIPFLIVSGVIGEETAVEAMKAGAHDYLKKDNLHRLIPAIERELREAKIRAERREAETALKKNAIRLAEAQRLARLGDWEWHIPSNVFQCSTEMDKLLNRDPSNSLHHVDEFLALIHPDDREQVQHSIKDALDQKTPFATEFRIQTPEGQEYFIHSQAEVSYDEQGNPLQMLGVIQDITERKQHEREKHILEDQLRNTVFDCIITVDRSLTVRNLNYAAEQFFHISSTDAEGKPLKQLCEEGRESITALVEKTFKLQTMVREYQLAGTYQGRDWNYIIGVIPLKQDGIDEAVLVIRDVSRIESGESKPDPKHIFHHIVGKSPSMQRIFDLIRHLEQVDSTVLIQGDSGTGKELIASALHHHSIRRDEPFIKVNCAALPENLLESELFGHVKGAFTGATTDKPGRFELANQGTIFLDEIGDISPNLQKRLLRVLQEREIERVGSTKTIKIEVRIITATNRNLAELVADRQFREDLYYRLKVITIDLPCLKERREDIPLLVDYFFKKYRDRFGRVIHGIDPDVMDRLLQYDWPGNIRQLENVIEHAIALTKGKTIQTASLPSEILQTVPPRPQKTAACPPASSQMLPPISQGDNEATQLQEILDAVGWNRSQAARRLGVNRNTIWRKIKKYGLVPPEERP